MKMHFTLLSLLFCIIIFNTTWAKIYKVGPGHTYTIPSQVSNLVADGDTVDIDAGVYTDAAYWGKNNLLLCGVNGYAHLKDVTTMGKAIWVIGGNNNVVEWIEFSGALVNDKNGAGIRGEGGSLTIRNCYFHDNEMGFLGNPSTPYVGDLLMEYCEFSGGGGAASSLPYHTIYVNSYNKFTIQHSYVHDIHIGHGVKSRAANTYILYNRITDENGDNARNIDIPDGGFAVIVGNIIVQDVNSSNANIIGYALESVSKPTPHELYVINNTIVNNKTVGSFLDIRSSGVAKLKAMNNIFAGPGTLISGGPAAVLDTANNWVNVNKTGFVNAASYDYRLTASSSAINFGNNPGSAGTFSLSPIYEYVHKANKTVRGTSGKMDAGAYEYNSTTDITFLNNQVPVCKVFPNPANSFFHISISSEVMLNGTILKIVDVCGKEIKTVPINKHEISIEIEELKSGVYFYSIINGNGNTRLPARAGLDGNYIVGQGKIIVQ